MATAKQRQTFGEFMAADGKIDAVKVTELFYSDVVFNNEDEIVYDGKHHDMVGLQFNSDVLDRYPTVAAHYRAFGNAIRSVAQFVEENKLLMIPKTMFHKRLLVLTRKQPITGITFLDLCAWHLLRIKETGESTYTVSVDRNLVNGLPACRRLMAELVKTLRAYNGKQGAFKVTVKVTGEKDILDAAVAGAEALTASETLTVSEAESPFAGVLNAVRAAAKPKTAVTKVTASSKPNTTPAPKTAKQAAVAAPHRVWAVRGTASYRAKWMRGR
ncbi:MAG: hypothetical protein IJD01_02270 [Clostridia bacterium]|nr:hypothetical protein [Clostridia bacterium]